jgi:glycosyltransferase 2 family protein
MEATMIALLVLNNVAHPQAVAATVLIRLTTLWFAVGLGLIALTMPERKQS